MRCASFRRCAKLPRPPFTFVQWRFMCGLDSNFNRIQGFGFVTPGCRTQEPFGRVEGLGFSGLGSGLRSVTLACRLLSQALCNLSPTTKKLLIRSLPQNLRVRFKLHAMMGDMDSAMYCFRVAHAKFRFSGFAL